MIQVQLGAVVTALAKLDERTLAHSVRVAAAGADESMRLLGLLHDVIEDTDTTLGQLCLLPHMENALCALTRQPGESYKNYINRIDKFSLSLAREVKIADLQDNLARMDATYVRLKPRYEAALKLLMEGAKR